MEWPEGPPRNKTAGNNENLSQKIWSDIKSTDWIRLLIYNEAQRTRIDNKKRASKDMHSKKGLCLT